VIRCAGDVLDVEGEVAEEFLPTGLTFVEDFLSLEVLKGVMIGEDVEFWGVLEVETPNR